MPNLHLTKVAFACRDTESLAKRIAARAVGGEVRVVTRMRPRRAGDLIGGSLFWIVKHQLVACQEILRFDDRDDGRIDIVCSDNLKPIVPRTRRAHQGWRYLEDESLKIDAHDESGITALPPKLHMRLAALALV